MMQRDPMRGNELTLRVELANAPGSFARLAQAIAQAEGSLGNVDIVSSSNDSMVRDICVLVRDENHGKHVVEAVKTIQGVQLVNVSDQIMQMHLGGKVSVQSKFPLKNRATLNMAHWPGSERVCRAILEKQSSVHSFTIKRNHVAILSDGSGVFEMGDIGPFAALPVQEGKAMIYNDFADIDAFPLCLDVRDDQHFIDAASAVAPGFGALLLNDIVSRRARAVQYKLDAALPIPVFHDFYDGSSIAALAALFNAMHVVGKEISKIRVVMDNIGHRATLLARLLKEAGVTQLIPVPTHKDHDTPEERAGFERYSGWKIPGTNLEEALNGADLFVSMRPQRLGLAADLSNMADKSIIFFLGDPDRGGDPSDVVNAGCIVAANRTDTPNQIDSILGSMGSLRGALDVYATEINLTMMIAAARSLADVIDRQDLTVDYILPSVFNRDVVKVVARSVAAAALKTQVGRRRWQKPTL